MARMSYGTTWSIDSGIETSCVSRCQPLGKSGRRGRSIMRATRVPFSPERPSRLKKDPGILPAEYMRSSTSTVSGRKSTSRGLPAVAVPSTIVSPALTTTEPEACLARRPVSNVISVPPISTETRCTSDICSFHARASVRGSSASRDASVSLPTMVVATDTLAPMAGRIVVFGATGYTGRLVAERLAGAGERPVLAGRSQERLDALAERPRRARDRPGDVMRSNSVSALVRRGRRARLDRRPVRQVGRAGRARRDRRRRDLPRLDRRAALHPPRLRAPRAARRARRRRADDRDGLRLGAGRAGRRAGAAGGRRGRGARRRRLLRARGGRARRRAPARGARWSARRSATPTPTATARCGACGRPSACARSPSTASSAPGGLGRRRRALRPARGVPAPARGQRLPRLGRRARAPAAGGDAGRLGRHAGCPACAGARVRGQPAGRARRRRARAGHDAGRRCRGSRRRPTTPPAGRSPRSTSPAPTATRSPPSSWPGRRAPRRRGRVTGTGAIGPVEAFGLEELERGCAVAGLSRTDA